MMKRVLLIALALLLLFSAVGAQNSTPRLRELDFSPFDEALAGFSEARAAEIDALVRDASIPDVQAAMQSGALTSEELTLYFLSRIRTYDEGLRTYVELNPAALEEARAADALRAAGTVLGSLHGIPVNLKDNIETAAPMHTTAGAEILLNHQAAADAPLVAQLRAAGAVILGKANLSEFAGAIAPPTAAGFSAVGGQTRNPHGAYSTAGSSSGSAASTAAYLTMVSVGSETSGSLVAPSAFNGVVGMYPGSGLVDHAGIIPLVQNNDTAGPVGRSVMDVALLLAVIDTAEVDYAAGLDAGALDGLNVGLLAAEILAQPAQLEDNSDNRVVVQRLADSLEASGAALRLVTTSGGTAAFNQLFAAVLFGGIRYDMMGYLAQMGAPATTVEELVAYNAAEPQTRIPFGQMTLQTAIALNLFGDRAQYEAAGAQVRARAAEILDATFADQQVDVLITLNNYHSPYYATANYPAITVPLGLRANGMPVGGTFIGKPGSEAQLLAVAYAFEQATSLRVNPALGGE